MKQLRILRPSSVRIGMFWRFGLVLDSRPGGGRGLVEGRVQPARSLGEISAGSASR